MVVAMLVSVLWSSAAAWSLVPNANCSSVVKLCYQADNATIHAIIEKDVFKPCQYSKHRSNLLAANCSSSGYSKFIAMDPIFRKAGLWRRPLLEPA